MGAPAHSPENMDDVLKEIVNVYDVEHAIGNSIIGVGTLNRHTDINKHHLRQVYVFILLCLLEKQSLELFFSIYIYIYTSGENLHIPVLPR